MKFKPIHLLYLGFLLLLFKAKHFAQDVVRFKLFTITVDWAIEGNLRCLLGLLDVVIAGFGHVIVVFGLTFESGT